jgi:hypothetical protein
MKALLTAAWKGRLLHFIAAGNIIVGVLGLLFDLRAIFRVTSATKPFIAAYTSGGFPLVGIYFRYLFPFVCAIAVAWFASCILSGVYLWRREVRGYRFALFLAFFAIGYFIVVILFLPVTSERAVQFYLAFSLAQMRVDNLLSLYHSLVLLLLLGIFFRKADFQGGEIPVETTGGGEPREKLRLRSGFIYLVRGLGVANLVLGFVGIAFTCIDVVATYVHRSVLSRRGFSFKVSLIGAAIDLGFVAGLFFAGYLLVKLDRRGMVLTNFILIAEVVYWFVSSGTPALKSFTNFGLTPQLLTAYPLFALPLLNWSARHLNQCQAWKRQVADGLVAPVSLR